MERVRGKKREESEDGEEGGGEIEGKYNFLHI